MNFQGWLAESILSNPDLAKKVEPPTFTGGTWHIMSMVMCANGDILLTLEVDDEVTRETDDGAEYKEFDESLVVRRYTNHSFERIVYRHEVRFGKREQVC
jgi:hypothetical protein